MLKVKKGGPLTTHNYFNDRVMQIDSKLVDDDYTKRCEKLAQVVILTPADQERMGDKYNYSSAPEAEKMPLEKGIGICPQYWCIRDEIPLSESQLVVGDDKIQRCPECGGKVRITDKEDTREFTVIKRKTGFTYPKWKKPSEKTSSKKSVPCCYQKAAPAASTAVLGPKVEIDDYYVLTSGVIPPLRIAYLPPELSARIGVKTNYATTCPRNRIEASATDMFRVGMGLPRKTLPVLLDDRRPLPSPANAKDKILQCSFFRTWTSMGEGDTLIERITDGIDKAFREETLSRLDEIEYISLLLDCRVIRINTTTNTLSCGFWSDKTSARSRTLVLLDTDVLGKVSRRAGNTGTKFDYVADVSKFDETAKNTLRRLHSQACAAAVPTFDDAVKAGADRERFKNEGQAYANDVIPKAQGAASRLKEEADGYRGLVVAQAEGDASRFKQVLTEYQKAPAVTRDRLYVDTMREVYGNVSKVMVDVKSGSNLLYLPLDKLMQVAGAAAPAPLAPAAVPTEGVATPQSGATDTRSRDNQRTRDRESR
jgi:hypothetical protein